MPADKPRHVQYGPSMQNMFADEPDFWNRVIMTNDAYFTLCRSVNTQNVHY